MRRSVGTLKRAALSNATTLRRPGRSLATVASTSRSLDESGDRPKPHSRTRPQPKDAFSSTELVESDALGTVESLVNLPRKTRTKVAFDDLPVALTKDGKALPPLPPDWKNDVISTTTGPTLIPSTAAEPPQIISASFPKTQLADDIVGNLTRFPHCILLTRVGNFYESYFDQALDVAKLLTIKLASRSWGGKRVNMCGFPLAHLDRHLKRLVQTHKRFVAVCEEFKRHDGSFARRVVRVVTPGTLIDESFVNPFENNYLMSISPEGREASSKVGLAWIDVATGEFFSQDVGMDDLPNEIARIGPKEVVLHQRFRDDVNHAVLQMLRDESITTSFISPESSPVPPPNILMTADGLEAVNITQSVKASISPEEESAISLLTAFLQGSLLEHMPHVSFTPMHQTGDSRMHIDSHTIKALEIKTEMREGGTSGSLLRVIKRTVTSSGTRLLERWLCSPSTSVALINNRQSLVAVFYNLPHFRRDVVHLLKQTEDATRIVQKFLLGKGDTDDLLAIKDTIGAWNKIKSTVNLEQKLDVISPDWQPLVALMERMADLSKLADLIESAVDDRDRRKEPTEVEAKFEDDPYEERNEVEDESAMVGGMIRSWTIKPQFSRQLTALHRKLKMLQNQRDEMEAYLRQQTGATSLVLQSTGLQGWAIRIPKAKEARVMRPPVELEFVELSKGTSSRSYFYAPWATLGSSIVATQVAILDAERSAFITLRKEVNSLGLALRRTARVGDELDVATAFAQLAEELHFCRPVINESRIYSITNGRHPTVELGLLRTGRNFVPNSINLHPDSRLHIITGPNMAGKSTLLRQAAIIAILAQTGSYVPADAAEIGIVDKVFSRIGAKDDLYRDRSTFMVEMLETAEILKNATSRSLVIMDEVGRGTTVRDGIAISFATVLHLYQKNESRALFATHFHEVADMLGYDEMGLAEVVKTFPSVAFFCTDVDETDDGFFTYSHKMREGVNRDSHGIKVARMAGVPTGVIEAAMLATQSGRMRSNDTAASRSALQDLGRQIASALKHPNEVSQEHILGLNRANSKSA